MTIEIITDLPMLLGRLLESIVLFFGSFFGIGFLLVAVITVITSLVIYFKFFHVVLTRD